MAYIQASGGGANKPFKEFDDLTYVTTGLSTSSCTILSGGYCEKDGYCYIKVKIKSNNIGAGGVFLSGFPKSYISSGSYKVLITLNECEDWEDAFPPNVNHRATLTTTTVLDYDRLLSDNAIGTNVELWIYCKYKLA